MANLIPNFIFGSHLDVTSMQILGCGISLAVALYLAQRWKDGNKTFNTDYMIRGDGTKLSGSLPSLITKHITPNLKAYTPRVVRKLQESMDNWLGGVQDNIIMENPVVMIHDMVVNASASVFVGEELCNNKEFINTAKVVTTDIGNIVLNIGLIGMMPRLSALYQRFLFTFTNTASKHIAVVCRVTGPEIV
ncbi:hypothetical protein BC938DRAFT_473106, partial [Jimgerdemannia flammicorona]